MTSAKKQKAKFDKEFRRIFPAKASAIKGDFKSLRDKVKIAAVTRDLEKFGGVYHSIDFESFENELSNTMEKLYIDGVASGGVMGMDAASRTVTFDPFALTTENWIKDRTAVSISGITDRTKSAVKQIIGRGALEGRNQVDIARDIKERVGLSERDELAVENFKNTETKRLLKQGKTEAQVEKIVSKRAARKANMLHRVRAERIARTELVSALNGGRRQAWLQAVSSGDIPGSAKREWVAGLDERTCPICGDNGLHGQETGINESFELNGVFYNDPPAHPDCRCTTILNY